MKARFLLTFLCAVRAVAADVGGTWDIDADFLGTKSTVECTFRQTDRALAGSCKGDTFPAAAATGSVTENVVQFSFTLIFADQPYPCTYTGKLQENGELTGTILIKGIDGVNGQFRAKKQ